MHKQVNEICKAAWSCIRNISRIRRYLDQSSMEKLIHAFVTSKLDNNNSLLYGLPKWQLDKLQRIQNAAARIVFRSKKFDHVTPLLMDLHWLPIEIKYKILLLTYKALHGTAPKYISELLTLSNSNLRSNANNDFLLAPKSKSVRYGDRTFSFEHHFSGMSYQRLYETVAL